MIYKRGFLVVPVFSLIYITQTFIHLQGLIFSDEINELLKKVAEIRLG